MGKVGADMGFKKNIVLNVYGGNVTYADEQATVNIDYHGNIDGNVDKLDDIIKGIMDSISGLQQENANKIVQVVEMTKEELSKPVPSVSRLGKCLSAITSMVTIVNGFPALVSNLNKLQEFVGLYMH